MKKITMTGIENLLNTTEEPTIHPEFLRQHAQLKAELTKARDAMLRAGRKPSRILREAVEVAQANLSAYERRIGLTGEDRGV
jgi:hypothetical protein